MLLKDHVSLFVRRESEDDPYGVRFDRVDLSGVMAFEKCVRGADGREEGSAVIYFFPHRSRVTSPRGGEFPELAPGDYCAVGKWREGFDPLHDQWDACRRITSVTVRKNGSEKIRHIVIEAK